MISKVYERSMFLDENENFGVFDLIAKYVIIWEGIWRNRVMGIMDFIQVKFEICNLKFVSKVNPLYGQRPSL